MLMHGNLSKAQKAVGQTPKEVLKVLIVFLATHPIMGDITEHFLNRCEWTMWRFKVHTHCVLDLILNKPTDQQTLTEQKNP